MRNMFGQRDDGTGADHHVAGAPQDVAAAAIEEHLERETHGETRLIEPSSLVDLRGLAKPSPFDGTEANWQDWRFRFEAMTELLGMEDLMRAAAEARGMIDEDKYDMREKKLSRLLWSILAQQLHGRAYALLKLTQKGCGMTAWGRLWTEFEGPDLMGKQMAVLSGLLDPKWQNKEPGEFMECLNSWEYALGEFEAISSIRVPECIRTSIILTKAPRAIRHYLQVQSAETKGSYKAIKLALQMFLASCQA